MTKKITDAETGTIVFSFEDDGEDIVFNVADVAEGITAKLALHGASQKIGDSYAGAKKACEDTDIDPIEYAREQVAGVIAQLKSGDWTVRVGGGSPATTDLAKALAEATGATVEEWSERLVEADADEKKSLRAHPAVKAVLDRFRAERAAAKAAKSASEESDIPLPQL